MATVRLAGLTLRVSDLGRSLDFYMAVPGARLVHHQPGRFAQVDLGGGLVGLLQAGKSGFHMEFATDDVAATHADLTARGIEPDGPPRPRPWGDVDFDVTDPDGYVLEFEQAAPDGPPDAA